MNDKIVNGQNAALAAAMYNEETGRFNTNRQNVQTNAEGTVFWVDGEPKTMDEMLDYLFQWECKQDGEYIVLSCNGEYVEHFLFYNSKHTALHLQKARNARCVLCELGVPDIHSETRARRAMLGF